MLIAEAIRLFGARGFEGASLDEVAAAAGVRKQTLLYYFPAKEDLFDACVAEVGAAIAGELHAALDAAFAEPDEAWTRQEDVIRTMFRIAEEHPEFPPFIREASRRSPEVVARMAAMLEPLRKRALTYLERGMEAGVFRRQDPGFVLFTLYTSVVGSLTEAGVLRAVAGRSSGADALRRRCEELIEFVRRALAP